jgi:hypothetical protein
MRRIIMSAALLGLAGCYHTTVTELPDNQRRVTFVNDVRPPFANTSPILAEDAALWRASHACPTGFKVMQENLDLGSYPNAYSIVVQCHDIVTAQEPPPVVQ